MNTDASNVEVINILQLKERLSMSCIESSGERSNILRNRSFTLCKNDRDLEKGSILWRWQNPYQYRWPTCQKQVSPFLFSTFVITVPLIPRAQKYLTCISGFPGFPMQSRQARSDPLRCIARQKFIIGFDFPLTLSSPASSCVLFDTTSRQLVELKWLMLNKHKRWFHSSCMNFHFVNMSASWFLVSVYLIWILVSQWFDRTTNQSRATLWVRETCLIVGLLPFHNHFNYSASLSSNTYNKASWCEDWTFEGTEPTLISTLIFPWDFWLLVSDQQVALFYLKSESCFPKTETIKSHNYESKQARLISIQRPKEMISDSVELSEIEVCFLHIQLIGTNLWLPKMHIMFLQK